MHGNDPKLHPSTLRWIIALSLVAIVLLAINLLDTPETDRPTTPGQALGQAQN